MYSVQLSKTAEKRLKKLYKSNKVDYDHIFCFIDKLDGISNPRLYGKALQGNLKGLWRYRVGGYRIISEIKDDKVIILILDLSHRKEIYR